MPVIFEVKYFVDGRKLGDSLMALDGLALGHPNVTPVRQAAAHNGEVKSTLPAKATNMAEVLAHLIVKSGVKHLNYNDLKRLCVDAGGSETSAGHYSLLLRQMKVLQGGGVAGKGYRVLTGAKKYA